MISTLEILVASLICLEIAIICLRLADKECKIVDKLSKIDAKNSKEVVENLLQSQVTKDFLFDVAYNLLSHSLKAGILTPYLNDFYNTFKKHVYSSQGHSGKLKKKALRELFDNVVSSHPLGKYASMVFGSDQIGELLGADEDPAKALEKLKYIMGFLKNNPNVQPPQQ